MGKDLKEVEEVIAALNKIQKILFKSTQIDLLLKVYDLNNEIKEFYLKEYKKGLTDETLLKIEEIRLNMI